MLAHRTPYHSVSSLAPFTEADSCPFEQPVSQIVEAYAIAASFKFGTLYCIWSSNVSHGKFRIFSMWAG